MKLTNKRIIGGLMALLFVVTIVQSQAIIKIAKGANVNKVSGTATVSSEDQTAQVLTASGNCVSVAPAGDVYKTNFADAEHQGSGMISYLLDFKIKNNCNYTVSIPIDLSRNMPATPSGVPSMALAQEYLQTIPLPEIQSPGLFSVTTWGPYSHDPFYLNDDLYGSWSNGVAQSPDGLVGLSGSLDASVPIDPMLQGLLYFYNIPPKVSKNFLMNVIVNSTDYSEFPQRRAVRAALAKFRWFKTSDFTNDNFLTANEVKTYTVPSPVNFASSYVQIFSPANNQMDQMRSSANQKIIDNQISKAFTIIKKDLKVR